jgi:hypothetical protein
VVADISASSEDEAMKSKRFERLVKSLDEVRAHVAIGRFAGRISKIDITAGANGGGDAGWGAGEPDRDVAGKES